MTYKSNEMEVKQLKTTHYDVDYEGDYNIQHVTMYYVFIRDIMVFLRDYDVCIQKDFESRKKNFMIYLVKRLTKNLVLDDTETIDCKDFFFMYLDTEKYDHYNTHDRHDEEYYGFSKFYSLNSTPEITTFIEYFSQLHYIYANVYFIQFGENIFYSTFNYSDFIYKMEYIALDDNNEEKSFREKVNIYKNKHQMVIMFCQNPVFL